MQWTIEVVVVYRSFLLLSPSRKVYDEDLVEKMLEMKMLFAIEDRTHGHCTWTIIILT